MRKSRLIARSIVRARSRSPGVPYLISREPIFAFTSWLYVNLDRNRAGPGQHKSVQAVTAELQRLLELISSDDGVLVVDSA